MQGDIKVKPVARESETLAAKSNFVKEGATYCSKESSALLLADEITAS